MEYNFIWSPPSAGAPIVSIATYGFTFNSYVIDVMGKPKKVLIGFDEEKRIIGVKPLEEGDDNIKAYDFINKERRGYIRLSNKVFIKYIAEKTGKNYSKSEKYLADWDDDEKILIIDLNKPLDYTETLSEEIEDNKDA